MGDIFTRMEQKVDRIEYHDDSSSLYRCFLNKAAVGYWP